MSTASSWLRQLVSHRHHPIQRLLLSHTSYIGLMYGRSGLDTGQAVTGAQVVAVLVQDLAAVVVHPACVVVHSKVHSGLPGVKGKALPPAQVLPQLGAEGRICSLEITDTRVSNTEGICFRVGSGHAADNLQPRF